MLTVIGCGNPVRGDDGAGIEVIRRLKERFAGHGDTLRLIDAGTSGMEVLFQMRGASHVIIVDACRSGSDAGAVFRVPGSEVQTRPTPQLGLHGLRWDHALYAGQKLLGAGFLDGTEVFLIEAQCLDLGAALTPSVEQGVQWVVEQITGLLSTELPVH